MVLVWRRRQRSQRAVATLTIGADRAGTGLQVGRIHVFFRARILAHVLAWSGRATMCADSEFARCRISDR